MEFEIAEFDLTKITMLAYSTCGDTAMRDDPDDDRPQEYGSTLLGYELGGAYPVSVLDICTGEGREVDERVGKCILDSLKITAEKLSVEDVVGEQVKLINRLESKMAIYKKLHAAVHARMDADENLKDASNKVYIDLAK